MESRFQPVKPRPVGANAAARPGTPDPAARRLHLRAGDPHCCTANNMTLTHSSGRRGPGQAATGATAQAQRGSTGWQERRRRLTGGWRPGENGSR